MITPERGKTYVVKHSSGLIDAECIGIEVYNPSFHSNTYSHRRSTTHYRFRNLATDREIVIKSRVKIKRQLGTKPYERGYS